MATTTRAAASVHQEMRLQASVCLRVSGSLYKHGGKILLPNRDYALALERVMRTRDMYILNKVNANFENVYNRLQGAKGSIDAI